MRILYVFPHPDDESFGPAAAIHAQLERRHEVFLLTLTKGGATRIRHELGLSVAEMGEVRYQEMLAVETTLGLTGMTVLDFPDGDLAEIDPRELERAVRRHIESVGPDVVVSYPVHGISGFHDHLVTHAVVKRVYLELRDAGAARPRRLAFLTLPDSGEPTWTARGDPRLRLSAEALIDCVVSLRDEDLAALERALACYATYQGTIAESDVVKRIGSRLHFEFYGEDCTPPVDDLTAGLEPAGEPAGP